MSYYVRNTMEADSLQPYEQIFDVGMSAFARSARHRKFMNMKNPYLIERLVKSKMDEMEREIQQAHLLKEAGLAESNGFARLVNALLNLFSRETKDHQNQRSMKVQPYEPCCDDAAD